MDNGYRSFSNTEQSPFLLYFAMYHEFLPASLRFTMNIDIGASSMYDYPRAR